MKKQGLATLAACALMATGAQAATNLLVNGSFENGNTSGWGQVVFEGVVVSGPWSEFGPPYPSFTGAEDGNYYLVTTGFNGYIWQPFFDDPGQTYDLTFWLQSNGLTGAPSPIFFDACINRSCQIQLTVPPADGWQKYSFTFVGSGDDTLYFRASEFWGLAIDNVSVVAVPEPATWALMLAGFAGLGAALRSRRSRRASPALA